MSFAPFQASTEKHTIAVNGQFLWADYAARKFTSFAMVESADISISEESEELPDSYTGDGNYDKITRVKAVVIDFAVKTFSPEVMAEMSQGTASVRAAATVSDELHTAYKGSVVLIEQPGADTYQLTDEAGTKTYVPGVDFFPTAAGPIPLTTGAIADGSKVKVSYQAGEANVVEWLTGQRKEKALLFHGINRANGKQVVVEVFRGKFGFVDKYALLGKSFRSGGLKFECLADPLQQGAGRSQWIRETYLK
ncbi:hypothetical protein NH8B_2113 [Pseudogulbenkiania sp. NH8B]|uniref:phage tail tube protein n=1 Tax=Pseudogulbenkiania sp. (strain NH8B) TaxID=748280 RepID=UPI0002279B5E|nr:hypothetical protein [Pseudogulbenkiania sp. NH8B]BAK76499.1 hypothetical protein NH8B_1682 [Pseudogulbenkiania sp. NH8B]BAK76928.1 hypothetical protein NH8B_2113 [Pseudogulbenkiania sp. NH8B]